MEDFIKSNKMYIKSLYDLIKNRIKLYMDSFHMGRQFWGSFA